MTLATLRFLRAHRILPAAAWAGALLFTAWVGAHLFWQLASAAPVASMTGHDPDPRSAARRIAAALGAPAAATVPAPAVLRARYRVVGLATGLDGLPGFALLRDEAGAVFGAAVGEYLPDGSRLEHIDALGVEIAAPGAETTTRLPAPAAQND